MSVHRCTDRHKQTVKGSLLGFVGQVLSLLLYIVQLLFSPIEHRKIEKVTYSNQMAVSISLCMSVQHELALKLTTGE